MSDIVVSTGTIIKTFVLIFFLWLFVQIQSILLLFFIAFLISFALLPLIEKLQKKISRLLACLVTYIAAVTVFLAVLSFGIPPVVEQTSLFISQLPRLMESVLSNPSLAPISRQFVEEVARQLAGASGNILSLTLGIFSSALWLITVFVFSFYFSLEYERIVKRFLGVLPLTLRSKSEESLLEIEERIGAWVRGELFLMVVIAVLTYAGLLILKVNYALPLALIAGLLEIVPVIGPVVSSIPAIVVGFSGSTVLGLGVLALFILVQQFENNIIVPRVMERVIGFDPLLTLSVILIGGKIFGIGGAFLAVPVALILQVLLKKFVLEKK